MRKNRLFNIWHIFNKKPGDGSHGSITREPSPLFFDETDEYKKAVLSDLPAGSYGRIFKIKPCPLEGRLRELGFTEGTKVAVLHENIGRSACAYYIKGAVIALRKEDSSNIVVREDYYV